MSEEKAPVSTEEQKPAEQPTPAEEPKPAEAPKPAEEPKPDDSKTAFSDVDDPPAVEPKQDEELKPDKEKPEEEEKPAEEQSVLEQALSDVEMPEGIVFSEADQTAVGELVAAHNLPKEAVSDLVKFQVAREQNRMEEAKKANDAYVAEMKSEVMKLPKEDLAAAKRFVMKFGSEGLKSKMADPNFFIGNDADIYKAFAIAQKAVDGGFVSGDGNGGSEKSLAETMYKV